MPITLAQALAVSPSDVRTKLSDRTLTAVWVVLSDATVEAPTPAVIALYGVVDGEMRSRQLIDD